MLTYVLTKLVIFDYRVICLNHKYEPPLGFRELGGELAFILGELGSKHILLEF